ncbi:MAG: hypothetical protein LBB59_00985 [Campylobacteraceae bacterium]|jgi:hypothetical protein|nr:hypothetical protein [Campylobacteraceae bacterium]
MKDIVTARISRVKFEIYKINQELEELEFKAKKINRKLKEAQEMKESLEYFLKILENERGEND